MARPTLRLHRFWPTLILVLAWPAIAEAHHPIPGMGEVANGIIHPLVTPAQLLVMIGLALLLAQRKPLALGLPIAVFAPVAALGLALTTTGMIKTEPPVYLTGVSLCLGLVVAIAPKVPSWVIAILCALAAMTLGLDSIADGATTTWAVTKTLFGTWLSFLLVIVDLAYYVSLLPPRQWLQIGVRVAGSWIVAISFLVLAFALKH